ncbi:hypothetical protein BCR44DRAFT_1035955 [Catenaria anguillulae PL171]|uniref:6-pyruvoyltetrahydropterin synthase n=1 Tax=Catenaria anguillulae PL171 TaxID=765915 RepID=A0A1Y2HSR8_9FUNG|nr:hypothetical protein BCR44DRAFT_1035955 [Catenaria anguillulae PL171]
MSCTCKHTPHLQQSVRRPSSSLPNDHVTKYHARTFGLPRRICLPPPIATISRIEKFSSAHRLHSPHLTDEENAQIFGKCNHVNFHGHNYTLQVDVRGPIDPRTGMVVNITDLKKCIQDSVMSLVDHRNLDLDVPYFAQGIPSTTENLAVFVYRTLAKHYRNTLVPLAMD